MFWAYATAVVTLASLYERRAEVACIEPWRLSEAASENAASRLSCATTVTTFLNRETTQLLISGLGLRALEILMLSGPGS